MEKLKVCIFTETYYPVIGGGETQARMLAEGLIAHSFDVIVLTRRSDPLLKKIEQFGEITVYRLPPAGKAHLKKWGLLITGLPKLIKLHQHYDLIFVSGFRIIGVVAVLMSKLLGKTCILKADSLGEMSGDFFEAGLTKVGLGPSSLPFRVFLFLRNKILNRANAFVAISSEITMELQNYGVPLEIIHQIPNSVDANRFHPVDETKKHKLRRKLELPDEAKLVTFTGRLVSYKGLPLLLRVWQKIQSEHAHITLLLIGSGGLDIHNCEAELHQYVSANGLQGSVRFTGSVQNVHEYLQASDIFVFPTENEAFGISLIEAMACGLPAVSTDVGGVKDIIQHQQNGLVVSVGDNHQLYQALTTLITDTALSSYLGYQAWQTVQERYTTDKVIQEYIELFKPISKQFLR